MGCIVLLLLTINQTPSKSNASSPPLIYAGSPTTAPLCAESGCHGGGQINVGPGNITITSSAVNNLYYTDSTYTITYTVNESGRTSFGFESVVLNGSLNPIGTFSIINSSNSFTTTGSSGRIYVGHRYAGSNNSWTVKWKAPSTLGGPVTFYACGNAANGNGSADAADHIYKSTLTLNAAHAGIDDVETAKYHISVYPNPSVDRVSIDMLNPAHDKTTIELFDVNMKNIASVHPESSGDNLHTSFDVSNFSAGVYFVRIHVGNDMAIRKLLITGN